MTANPCSGRWSIVLPDFWENRTLRVLQLAVAILAIVVALLTSA
ncbi:MAG: hypothetical protein PVG79_10430 [Gemmatimonadales bacterium]